MHPITLLQIETSPITPANSSALIAESSPVKKRVGGRGEWKRHVWHERGSIEKKWVVSLTDREKREKSCMSDETRYCERQATTERGKIKVGCVRSDLYWILLSFGVHWCFFFKSAGVRQISWNCQNLHVWYSLSNS